MPEPPTIAEVDRAIRATQQRLADKVDKAVFDTEIKHLSADLSEIKESQKWMMRLIVTQLFGLIIALIIYLATQGLP